MSTRYTFTPAKMRELAAGRGSQFLIDDMRAALRYAADLIEAANAVIEENRMELARRTPPTPKEPPPTPHSRDGGDPSATPQDQGGER